MRQIGSLQQKWVYNQHRKSSVKFQIKIWKLSNNNFDTLVT